MGYKSVLISEDAFSQLQKLQQLGKSTKHGVGHRFDLKELATAVVLVAMSHKLQRDIYQKGFGLIGRESCD